MYTVFVARTTGGLVVQKDFEQLERAKSYYSQLFEHKPYEGVMVMLLEKKGYFRSFLLDANVIPSSVKPSVIPVSAAGLEVDLK